VIGQRIFLPYSNFQPLFDKSLPTEFLTSLVSLLYSEFKDFTCTFEPLLRDIFRRFKSTCITQKDFRELRRILEELCDLRLEAEKTPVLLPASLMIK
jgi:hypothetical protein